MKVVSDEEESRQIYSELDEIYIDISDRLPESVKSSLSSSRDLVSQNFESPEIKEIVLKGFMRNAKGSYHSSIMDYLFASFDDPGWYKGNAKLLYDVIGFLFENFERKSLCHEKYIGSSSNADMNSGTFYYAKNFHEIVRGRIGMSLNHLLKPSMPKHKKLYFEKLGALLADKTWGFGRVDLVIPYARMGKNDVIVELIDMLDDRDVAQNAIKELGRLKAKEAIPKLSQIINCKDHPMFVMEGDFTFHKELAQKAIRQINKDLSKT